MSVKVPALLLAAALILPAMLHAQLTGAVGETESGVASVYRSSFNGRRTASSERYHQNAMTAAHKTLPFGTKVRITRVKNGKTVDLRVNDRGPHRGGRIVDLSLAAAKKLGMHRRGLEKVKLEVIEAAQPKR